MHSTGLSALSCVLAVVMHIVAVCLRRNKVDYYYYYFRVRTDPGKVWKVLEFNVEILKALKSLENDHRYGKVSKNP